MVMEAASTSETSANFYQTTGTTTQKTAIFTLAAVRTSNLNFEALFYVCNSTNIRFSFIKAFINSQNQTNQK
jgi:hypothetical protein